MRAALPLALLLAASACRKENTFAPPPPPAVTVAHPDASEVTTYRDFPATLSGYAEVDVRARVKGVLESYHFREGMQVEEGQLLFEIEKAPFEAAVQAAEAELANAVAARGLAQARADRLRKAGRGAVSELDIEVAEAEVDQAAAVVSRAEAALESARIDLSYTTIRAAGPGRTSESLVSTGNLVGPGAAELLAHITDDSRLYAYFEVPERGMLRFLAERADEGGTRTEALPEVRLELANGELHPHPGTIDFVDSRVDPATRTATVRALFPNPDGTIASGLFARVGVPRVFPSEEFPNATRIPAAAVQRDLAGEFVWVVDETDTVRRRGVEGDATLSAPAEDPNAVPQRERLILRGLSPEDRVIVAGLQRAREGATVAPEMQGDAPPKPETPANAPTPAD